MKIKTIYTRILSRLGFCNTLPSEYIDSIRIKECDEPLHWHGKIKVRSAVAKKLTRVKDRLKAKDCEVNFVYGYLNLRWQQKLLGDEYGYETGGAVFTQADGIDLLVYKQMKAEGFVNYPKGSNQFHYGDKIWAAYSGKRRAIYGDAFEAQTKCCEEFACPYHDQYLDWLTNDKDRTKWEDEHPKASVENNFKEYYNPHCTECMENNLDDCANCDDFWGYYVEGDKIPDIIYDKL